MTCRRHHHSSRTGLGAASRDDCRSKSLAKRDCDGLDGRSNCTVNSREKEAIPQTSLLDYNIIFHVEIFKYILMSPYIYTSKNWTL
jgi:hypothetical protein